MQPLSVQVTTPPLLPEAPQIEVALAEMKGDVGLNEQVVEANAIDAWVLVENMNGASSYALDARLIENIQFPAFSTALPFDIEALTVS